LNQQINSYLVKPLFAYNVYPIACNMISIPLLDYPISTKMVHGKAQVFDPIRRIWIFLTPEEHVRQCLIRYLTEALNYPSALMAVEKEVKLGNKRKRFDLVVYNRHTHTPWLLVECKAPEITLTNATLQQLLHYQNQLQCRYWMVSNGHQHFCADAADIHTIKWLKELPAYDL